MAPYDCSLEPCSGNVLNECPPEYMRRMIGDIDLPDDEYEDLAHALADGFAILVSDGTGRRTCLEDCSEFR